MLDGAKYKLSDWSTNLTVTSCKTLPEKVRVPVFSDQKKYFSSMRLIVIIEVVESACYSTAWRIFLIYLSSTVVPHLSFVNSFAWNRFSGDEFFSERNAELKIGASKAHQTCSGSSYQSEDVVHGFTTDEMVSYSVCRKGPISRIGQLESSSGHDRYDVTRHISSQVSLCSSKTIFLSHSSERS